MNNLVEINGQLYKKNLEAFKVNDKWVPILDNRVFDYYTRERVPKLNLVNGYVGKNVKGYFKNNPFTISSDDGNIFLNREIAELNGYKDVWYKEDFSRDNGRPHQVREAVISEHRYEYSSSRLLNFISPFYQKFVDENRQYEKSIEDLGRLIKYSYGIEIETSKGCLKLDEISKHGFVYTKDGSMRDADRRLVSLEYVSVPFKGSLGLYEIRNMLNILSQKTAYNEKCSIHLHLGGFEKNRTNIVSLYTLLTKIQLEVLSMFPYYKYKPKFGTNYCKLLSTKPFYNIHDTFQEYVRNIYCGIFSDVSCGYEASSEFNHNTHEHPIEGNKWDIKSRYHWVSFVSFMFSKQETVEFRIHTPTFNFEKILYWLLICNAILKFAETKSLNILKMRTITLDDVMTSVYKGKVRDELIDYIKLRKEEYSNPDSDFDLNMERDKKFNRGILI